MKKHLRRFLENLVLCTFIVLLYIGLIKLFNITLLTNNLVYWSIGILVITGIITIIDRTK